MGILDKMFGDEQNDGDDVAAMPWDRNPSIYDHVRAHTDPAHSGLTEAGASLPDEERINAGSDLRWAAGAMDGIATHHMGSGDLDQLVKEISSSVLRYCRQPTVSNKSALYETVLAENTVSIIDPVIGAITSEEQLDHQRLYDLAHSFVVESPDREPVKFGIAILGLFGQSENEELFQTLGRHDEFTLFCAVALSNIGDEAERSLWTLARNVDGWGRIHVVERLSQTEDPEIKDWLLREGFRNSVMYEYLAYTCATAGGLLAALSADHVDRELLASAGELIQALIAGGPAEGIDDYDDAALVVQNYLGHIADAEVTVGDFLRVDAIKNFLEVEDADWEARSQQGWTPQRRSELLGACGQFLMRPDWIQEVRDGLLSEDEAEFYQADQAAKALGIDTWDHHWHRLQQQPTDAARWYHVMSLIDDERLRPAIEVAERSIDLTQIATGPGDELGIGPDYEAHSCLDYLLQELRRFPGQGVAFVEAGLHSPVVRNRNMALAVLSDWTQDHWPASTSTSLQSAVKREPDDDLRQRMTKILNGESLQ